MSRFTKGINILSLLGSVYLLSGIFLPTMVFMTDHSRTCGLHDNCPVYIFEYTVTTTSAWQYFQSAAPLALPSLIILGLASIIPLFTALFVLLSNIQMLAKPIQAWEQRLCCILIGITGVIFVFDTALVLFAHSEIFSGFYPFSFVNIGLLVLVEVAFLSQFRKAELE